MIEKLVLTLSPPAPTVSRMHEASYCGDVYVNTTKSTLNSGDRMVYVLKL